MFPRFLGQTSKLTLSARHVGMAFFQHFSMCFYFGTVFSTANDAYVQETRYEFQAGGDNSKDRGCDNHDFLEVAGWQVPLANPDGSENRCSYANPGGNHLEPGFAHLFTPNPCHNRLFPEVAWNSTPYNLTAERAVNGCNRGVKKTTVYYTVCLVCRMNREFQAVEAAHGVHGVGGSNPLAPTKRIKDLGSSSDEPFSFARLLAPTFAHSTAKSAFSESYAIAAQGHRGAHQQVRRVHYRLHRWLP